MLASCGTPIGDPGTELNLIVTNRTGSTVKVEVPAFVPDTRGPSKEVAGASATIEAGGTKQLRPPLGLGWYAEIVKAYADGRLVYCERFYFPVGGIHTYRVEIVTDHIRPGCPN